MQGPSSVGHGVGARQTAPPHANADCGSDRKYVQILSLGIADYEAASFVNGGLPRGDFVEELVHEHAGNPHGRAIRLDVHVVDEQSVAGFWASPLDQDGGFILLPCYTARTLRNNELVRERGGAGDGVEACDMGPVSCEVI